jgi:hypothetical protein
MYPVAGNFFLFVGVPYRFQQFPSERSGIRKISPNFIRPVNFNVGVFRDRRTSSMSFLLKHGVRHRRKHAHS